LPANDAILSKPVEHLAEARLADALIEQFQTEDDYRDLRARLADLVKHGDPLRLPHFAYAMREPFAMPALAQQMADIPAGLLEQLAHAAAWLDVDVELTAPSPLKTGLSPDEHAQQIETVLAEAQALCEEAFAAVSPENQALIDEAVSAMSSAFVDHVMILDDPNRDRLAKVYQLIDLASRVDRGKLVAAATRLSALLDPTYLQGLRRDFAAQKPGIILERDTPFGPIVFAGAGETWFQQPAAIIVDLGGDDFYTQPVRRPFSVIIDLAGNDRHQATFERAQACGLRGVSLLYDAAGDDTYIARRWAQCAAALGVGVLWDRAGDDVYRAADYSQGAAFCGVGLLIDDHGCDRYEALRYAQALGLPGGFGALLERGGNDCYYCSGRDLTAYATPGVFAGWGQGCGVGFRNLASGGIALLLEEGGDDVYEGGNFAQGGGYYFGWGCLVDRSGDDRYFGSRYAQAFAAHQALGYLEDQGGNDRYVARRSVGQACAWDQSIAFLIERAGDDVYSGGGFGLAASAHNGFAVLVDRAGTDHYRQHAGQARAHPNDYHGGSSLSLLLDLGGAADRYPGPDRNGGVKHANQHGFFADLPGGIDQALREYRQYVEP
jgi:hypothetical protein